MLAKDKNSTTCSVKMYQEWNFKLCFIYWSYYFDNNLGNSNYVTADPLPYPTLVTMANLFIYK